MKNYLVFIVMIFVGCISNNTDKNTEEEIEKVSVQDTLTEIKYSELTQEQLKVIEMFWLEYSRAITAKDKEFIITQTEFPLEGAWTYLLKDAEHQNNAEGFEMVYDQLFTQRLVDSVKKDVGYKFSWIQQNQFEQIRAFRVAFYFEDYDEEMGDSFESAIILDFKVYPKGAIRLVRYDIAG